MRYQIFFLKELSNLTRQSFGITIYSFFEKKNAMVTSIYKI